LGRNEIKKRDVQDSTEVDFVEDETHDERDEVNKQGIDRFKESFSSVLAEVTKDIYGDDESHIVFLDQESELGFIFDENGNLVKNEHSRAMSEDVTQQILDAHIPALTQIWLMVLERGIPCKQKFEDEDGKEEYVLAGKKVGNRFFTNEFLNKIEKTVIDHNLRVREKSATESKKSSQLEGGFAEMAARMRTTSQDGSVREEEYIVKK
jgi:hypothetical protein